MTEEPLKHIIRPSLPWREASLTECGRPLNDVKVAVERSEVRALVLKHGPQRAAFVVCMTCVSTSDRHTPWDINPVEAMSREVERVRWNEAEAADLMRRELLAIEKLIEAHRDEFDELVAALGEVTDLVQARRDKTRRSR